MDELLGRCTAIPIEHVRDGARMRADTIYLAPARDEMILSSGRFILSEKESPKGFRLPIDDFFRCIREGHARVKPAIDAA